MVHGRRGDEIASDLARHHRTRPSPAQDHPLRWIIATPRKSYGPAIGVTGGFHASHHRLTAHRRHARRQRPRRGDAHDRHTGRPTPFLDRDLGGTLGGVLASARAHHLGYLLRREPGGGRRAVRLPRRAARLEPPPGNDDPDRGLQDGAHGCAIAVPGRHAGQPGRPGRFGPRPRRRSAQSVPNDAGDAYDWIGFDPRGVGSSVPGADLHRRLLAPVRVRSTSPRRGAARHLAATGPRPTPLACGIGPDGALLDHMTHRRLGARTWTSIRTALRRRADQLLRLLLRHLPRPGLRDAVPDAGAPHGVRRQRRPARTSGTSANLDQDVAFERNINIWFGWLAKYDNVYHLGNDRGRRCAQLLYHEKAQLAAHPGRRRRRPGRVDRHLPVRRLLPVRPGRTSATSFAAGSTTTTPARSSMRYTSARRPQRRQRLRHVPRRAVHRRAVADELGAVAARQLARLPARRRSRPGPTPGSTRRACTGRRRRSTPVTDRRSARSPSVLMIDETLDAATPYPGSLEVRSLLPRRPPDRRAGRHHARQLAVRQRLRRRPDRGLSRRRHPAGAQAGLPGGHLLRPAAATGSDLDLGCVAGSHLGRRSTAVDAVAAARCQVGAPPAPSRVTARAGDEPPARSRCDDRTGARRTGCRRDHRTGS